MTPQFSVPEEAKPLRLISQWSLFTFTPTSVGLPGSNLRRDYCADVRQFRACGEGNDFLHRRARDGIANSQRDQTAMFCS